MKLKISKDKVILVILATLFMTAAFEIIAYFFYIYKPASQILGSEHSYRLEIPALSEILKPSQITNTEISLDDSSKTLFPEKIYDFKGLLDTRLQSANSFVNTNTFIKDSSMTYILGGTVVGFSKLPDGSISVRLKNSVGTPIDQIFLEAELMKTKVSLVIFSITNPSRTEVTLDKILPEDYLIIKTSTNLLSKDPPSYEIEIFRTPKQ